MRVIHLITDLNQGGAEIILSRLLPELQKRGFEQRVICMRERGVIGDTIKDLGFQVDSLNMHPSTPSLKALAEIISLSRKNKTDLLQTWMYHADYYSCLAHPVLQNLPIIWGLHNSTLSSQSNPLTRAIAKRLAVRSWNVPRAVISCSHAAIRVHQALGYDARKMVFVPNGFDTRQFKPDPDSRARLRTEWGLSDGQKLVGNISRFDQQKNHQGIIACWKILAAEDPEMRFLLAGKNLDSQNTTLLDWLQQAEIADRTLLLGIRTDVPDLLNALDLFVMSSNSGEAFPLIVGEAMSCGTLCSLTDIGDCAALSGDCGRITAINDPEAQAQACRELLDLPLLVKNSLRTKARKHIEENYSLAKMAEGYEAVYEKAVSQDRQNHGR